MGFRKDAAATESMDWSQMNADLCNFHTSVLSSPSPLSQQNPGLRLTIIPSLHMSGICGMLVSVSGPLVNVAFVSHLPILQW